MKAEKLYAPGIILLALALRLARLTFQPLWADEGYSVYFASLDPMALAAATAADIHPPLYYYLLKAWMTALGPGDFSIRLLSVMLGVVTVVAVYTLGTRLAGARAGAVAALVLAVSPFHVYYSQEVRMYALAALLATISTYLMLRVLTARSDEPQALRRRQFFALLYVATTALALYTLYYAAFVPIAQSAYVLLRYRRQRATIAGWLGLQAAALLLYLPWIAAAAGALTTYVAGKVAVEQYAPLSPLSFVAQILAAVAMGVPSIGRWWLALGALAVLALGALGVLKLASAEASETTNAGGFAARDSSVLLATMFAGPIVLGYLVNLLWPFSPLGFQRLFITALPFLCVIVGQGVVWGLAEARRERGRAVALVLLTVCAAGFAAATLADFYTTPRYVHDDYRPLVLDMAALANPADVVVALYPWQLGFVRSYFVGEFPRLAFVERRTEWANYPAVMRQDLERLGQGGRIWFPSYEAAGGLLERSVAEYLTDNAYPAFGKWYGNSRLSMYAFAPVGPARPAGIVSGGLALLAVQTSLEPVAAGRDCVRLSLQWRLTGVAPQDAEVALRLVDDRKRTWARRDSPPRNGLQPFSTWPQGAVVVDNHALPIPSTVPPGSYRLVMSVYDQTTQRDMGLTDASGQSLGAEVELASVVVTKGAYRPPLQALALPHPTFFRFQGAPELVGYDAPASLRPGFPFTLDLYWRAVGEVAEDPSLFVQARDQTNKVWGLYEGSAIGAQYQPSRWTPGEVLRGQVSFVLAPDAPAGDYGIYVGWLKGRSKVRVPLIGGGEEAEIVRLTAVTRQHVTTLPNPASGSDARLGDDIQLLGFDDAPASVQPAGHVPITLYWRALGRMEGSYAVFVHLVDAQGRVWAQQDSEPAGGEAPTTSWLPGEVIADSYVLNLPANVPPGLYTVVAGMYDQATGRRLPVREAAGGAATDSVRLNNVTVE